MSLEAMLDLFVAYQRTAAVKSAVELDVFTAVGEGCDAYTVSELDRRFRSVGFARTELHDLAPTTERVLIAHRSS
jgi:hypothetical protein